MVRFERSGAPLRAAVRFIISWAEAAAARRAAREKKLRYIVEEDSSLSMASSLSTRKMQSFRRSSYMDQARMDHNQV